MLAPSSYASKARVESRGQGSLAFMVISGYRARLFPVFLFPDSRRPFSRLTPLLFSDSRFSFFPTHAGLFPDSRRPFSRLTLFLFPDSRRFRPTHAPDSRRDRGVRISYFFNIIFSPFFLFIFLNCSFDLSFFAAFLYLLAFLYTVMCHCMMTGVVSIKCSWTYAFV